MSGERGSRCRQHRPGTAVALLGIVLVGFALRARLFRDSLFGDELFSYEVATRARLGDVLDGVRSDLEITPPLYFVLAWLTHRPADAAAWLRAPSMVAGTALIPLVYLLGARTFGRRTALVGATFVALHPLATYYSAEARAYALMTTLVVLSTIVLLRALEAGRLRWWAVFGLLVAAALGTHYTAVFVLGAQAVWAGATMRTPIRPLVLAHLGAALLLLPWAPSLQGDLDARPIRAMARLTPFTAANTADHLGRISGGGPYAPLSEVPGHGSLAVVAGLGALALAVAAIRFVRSRPPRLARPSSLVVLLAVAAPAGAAVVSALTNDMFVARNLLVSLPYLALAFAAALVRLPRPINLVAVLVAVAALGVGAVRAQEDANRRPAYHHVASYLEEIAEPGDVVLELRVTIDPANRVLHVQLDPDLPWYALHQEEQAVRAAEAAGGRILYVEPGVEGLAQLGPELVEARFRETGRRSWPGLYSLTVIVYEPEPAQP